MPNKPSISTRKWIKRGDNPPSETSDVLVLTSPQNHYTDVRLPFPSHPLSAQTTIDWAFAGTSASTPATETRPAHTVWKHWIDSETVDVESLVDEGDMVLQENGDVHEFGSSVGKDGKVESYVECWVEGEVGVIAGEGERRSWVVKVEDEGKQARGMVVRVGGWIQGILRREEEFCVGRWRWSDGGWKDVVRNGGLALPGELFGEVKIWEGNKFTGDDGLVWECVEEFSWS